MLHDNATQCYFHNATSRGVVGVFEQNVPYSFGAIVPHKNTLRGLYSSRLANVWRKGRFGIVQFGKKEKEKEKK